MKLSLSKLVGIAKKALPVAAAVLALIGKGKASAAVEKVDDALK